MGRMSRWRWGSGSLR